MAQPSLEWMLAARYLKLLHARRVTLHAASAACFLLAVAVNAAAWYVVHRRHGLLLESAAWRGFFQYAKPITVVAFVLVLFFVALVRKLTIFSTISTYGLFIGSAALVVVLSVMSGFEKDLKHKILGANAHVVVTAPDRPFTDYAEVARKLVGAKNVVAVSPFLTNEVMISSQSNLSGVIIKGIDPLTVGGVTDLRANIEQGSLDNLSHPEKLEPDTGWHAPAPDRASGSGSGNDAGGDDTLRKLEPRPARFPPAVVIGRELAKNLRTYLGDDVNLVSPMGDIGPTGSMPRARPFRVGGVFYSGMYEYDSKYIYVSIAAAQKFLGLEDEITGFELKVTDPEDTRPTVEDIERRLGKGFEVQDWQEQNRNLFSALKIEKIAMFIVLCFIVLVAGFSIVANGIMLVREKGREIAILKSMGASDRSVLNTFLIIGLFMGAIGTVVGITCGVGACLALRYFGLDLDTDVYYISKLPVELNPREILTVFVAAMLIALVATLYPALLAARLRPVEGLRYDRS